MAKKKEDKRLTKDQAEKKIQTLKKDLFNIRFKKINNQIENPAQYNEIKKNIGNWINKEIPDCKWKICIDTSPLLEKAWAEESGIGWIGKNSNLINKKNRFLVYFGFYDTFKRFNTRQTASIALRKM